MSDTTEAVTIESIADGAAVRLFNDALQQVLDNINDESRSPSAKRTITLKFNIGANEARNMAGVEVECNTKLAPQHKHQGPMYIRKNKRGKLEAVQPTVQPSLFDDETPPTPIYSTDRGLSGNDA